MSSLRLIGRGLLWGFLGLLLALLVALLAWVASNWRDDPPRPPPLELSLGPPLKGSPLFFKVMGMPAPEGVEPEAAGRALFAALSAGPNVSPPANPLPLPKGLPLLCQPPDDCLRQLLDTRKVAEQLAPHALLGTRCEAAAADGAYQEELPPRISMATLLPPLQGLTHCGAWFAGQAVLAAARGDREAALRSLRNGTGLAGRAQAGGRWLITVMVGTSVLRSQYVAVAAVAQLQPAWAADLASLVPPLPAAALDSRRWMLVEANAIIGSVDGFVNDCGDVWASADGSEGLSRNGGLLALSCKTRIGFLPEATRQRIVGVMQQAVQSVSKPLDVLVAEALARSRSGAQSGLSEGLAWRNTFGQMAVTTAMPSYDLYVLRLADLELHRVTLALALAAQAARVPLAERAAWLQAQPVPEGLKPRMAWEDQGLLLQAKAWTAETPGNSRFHAPVRVPVPAP